MSIYKKILELQKEIVVLEKDGSGHGYSYTTGDYLFSKLRPLMDKLGLLLFQEIIDSKTEHLMYTTKYGEKQQTFCECVFRFTWVDTDTSEKIEHLFNASGFNDWDKAIGSAMTYGERYYILKQFHIPTTKLDPDARVEEGTAQPQKKTWPGKKTEAEKLVDELKECGKEVAWVDVLKPFNVKKISDLTKPQMEQIRKDFLS